MSAYYEKRDQLIEVGYTHSLSAVHHLHKEVEIIYVESGEALAFADNNRYHLRAGDLFITFPNQVHFYKNISEKGKYFLIIATTDFLHGMKSLLKHNSPVSNKISVENNSEVSKLLNLLAQNNYTSFLTTSQIGYYCLLMSRLLPFFDLKPSCNTNSATLRNILDYCEEHFSEHITLDSAAESLHLSKYYISRLMNDKIKIRFNDHINTLRINAACEMLTDTDSKTSDISETVGFGTIRSFNRVFKATMSFSPQEYRKLYSNNKKNS